MHTWHRLHRRRPQTYTMRLECSFPLSSASVGACVETTKTKNSSFDDFGKTHTNDFAHFDLMCSKYLQTRIALHRPSFYSELLLRALVEQESLAKILRDSSLRVMEDGI